MTAPLCKESGAVVVSIPSEKDNRNKKKFFPYFTLTPSHLAPKRPVRQRFRW